MKARTQTGAGRTDGTGSVIVPMHREIKPGTFHRILKQAGLTLDEFQRLRREWDGMARYTYTVVLVPEPEVGGYSVEVPALPGCVTQGETVEEALTMARGAIRMWIEDLAADGEAIPIEANAPSLASVAVDIPELVGA